MDLQHRRPHPHPRHHPLAGPLIGAGEMRHVGRGAAHVEADDMVEPGLRRGLGHADDPARRPGQDRVLAAEGGGVGEAAVRLHEEEAHPHAVASSVENASTRSTSGLEPHDPVDIAPQHRRQIGVDHRRIAAPDQLDQRLDLVARADLGEADLLGQRASAPPRARSSASRASARSPAPGCPRQTPPAARPAPPRDRAASRPSRPPAPARRSRSPGS